MSFEHRSLSSASSVMAPAAVIVTLLIPLTARAAELSVGSGQTYATVSEAVAAAQPGDVVLVHTGTYVEDVSFAASGTDASRIVLRAAGDGPVVIEGAHEISGSYWDVEGVTVRGTAGSDAIQITGDFNRILSVELTGGTRDGIDGGGRGNEVRSSNIHGFDGGDADAHCIVLNPGAEDWVIEGNSLWDCSGDSIQLYSADVERSIKNITIAQNQMYYTGAIARMENAVDIKNADGLFIIGNLMYGFSQNKTIVAQKGPRAIEVRCNEMHTGFTGVEFRGEDGGTVEDVTFTRNVMHGFSEYALKFDGVAGASVFNNTFVDVASDGLRLEGAGLAGGIVRNNLWVSTGAIDGGGGLVADHNGFFMTGSVGIASPTDVNADPMLALYDLSAGSPMIDAGVDVGLEYAGAAPDIGWNEVGLDACGDLGAGGGPAGATTAAATGSSSSGAGGPSASGAGGASTTGGASGGDGDEGDGCDCRATPREGGSSGLTLLLISAVGLASALRRRARRT